MLVIAKADKAKEALDAGADFAGGDEYIKKIQEENWFGFDAMVATPDMMGQVGKIGRLLGPRGLMPNPKVGTVTPDVAKAVRELKAGRVEFRVEKAGIVHSPIGKASFGAREAGRERPLLHGDPAEAQAGHGQGHLRQVDHHLHHARPGHQDRPCVDRPPGRCLR